MGYNGPPSRKWALRGAIAHAHARVDAVIARAVPDDGLLDARLLELANVIDGTIDPVEYLRPAPPAPWTRRPARVDNTRLNCLIRQLADQAAGTTPYGDE